MKCTYIAEIIVDDSSVDTIDAIYIGGASFPIGLVFGVTVIELSAMQAALQSAMDDTGAEYDSVTYELIPDTHTYRITVVSSNIPVNGLEWTISGSGDGGDIFAASNCQACDYTTVITGEGTLYSICNSGSVCVSALGIDVTNQLAVLKALQDFFIQAGNIEYVWNAVLQTGTINITGYSGSLIPLKVTTETGNTEFAFVESNCAAVPETCESVVTCDDAQLSASSWLNKVIANSNVENERGVFVVIESGTETPIECGNAETWQTILKRVIRFVDPCYAVGITEVEGYIPFDCAEPLSIDSIAKRLISYNDSGCPTVRIQNELGDPVVLECGDSRTTFQLFKAALRKEDGGDKLSLAVSNGTFDNCNIDCSEMSWQLILRSLFLASGANINLTFIKILV